MILAFLPISYVLFIGIGVDDLGLLLVASAVVILMMGVIYRAVVTRVFAFLLMVPAVYIDFLAVVVRGIQNDEGERLREHW
ncbi:hypothetical protein BJV78DRAFT_1282834 [Lactifluus subvellereus]|nr:hypothetical protein BJV78DRAFT_1282834 [Lactifluus subvellereus]